MKKIFFAMLLMACAIFIEARTSLSEFELLSPEEMVDTILSEYKGDIWFAYKLDFSLKTERLVTEKEKVMPYILLLMKKYEAYPYGSEHNEIEILDNILGFYFNKQKKINDKELKELEIIYTQIIDKYLKKYKKIDSTAMILEISLMNFSTKKYPDVNLRWIRKMYRKYVKLGYEGLTIDYEELKRVSGID